MQVLELSKLDVAERQLHLAIELFFQQSDPVSIHSLSEASSQILRDIAPNFSKHSFYRQHQELSKSEQKELNRQLNEARNFFKHADKDPNEKIKFKPGSNHLSLFETSLLHSDIKGSIDIEIVIYFAWFLSCYSEYFPFPSDFMEKIRGAGLLKKKLSHAECLEMLNQHRAEQWLITRRSI
ncbi:hypothetical protein [Vibrio chagasii]|uniref:hypothetical protein n=1 Tax=Vibrio chagasii TaxID=170679 RepID=UPI002284658E|nr:hypothetical protein [Vibrio chagasii]MCY9826909.1 hypothetical protein [Vibrio chagasii]